MNRRRTVSGNMVVTEILNWVESRKLKNEMGDRWHSEGKNDDLSPEN